MKVYDARAIANFLLDYAEEKKTKVTLLSLLKMIFYAHGWYLSDRRQPLVGQSFEAWTYGPVVRVVWDAFKGNGKSPLNGRATRLDVITNSSIEVRDSIETEHASFLQHIFDAYAHLDAFDLSNETHLVGSPWDKVWNAPDGKINVGMKISNEEIQEWFSGMRARGFSH